MENIELKNLKILHIAFCIGTTAVLLINHFAIKEISFGNLNNDIDFLSLGIIGLGTLLAVLSMVVFRKITTADYEKVELENIRKAYILKWALLEGGALISFLIYYFVNGHQLTLISGLTLLFLLIVSGPKHIDQTTV